MTDMQSSSSGAPRRDLLISLAGAATSFAVVALNLLISRTLNFNLLSLSYWFVLPAGALIGGMGAASGYYFAAKLTHTMPSRRLLVDMVLVGGAAWYAYHWLDYYTLRFEDGTVVRDIVSFWDYFIVKTEHARLSLSVQYRQVGDTGELGTLGFVREFLQFAGFLAGGLAAYGFLMEQEICDQCRRYAKNETLLSGVSPEVVDSVLEEGDFTLPGLIEQAQLALRGRPLAGIDLVLLRCPDCTGQWLRPSVVTRSGNSFNRTRLNRYAVDAELAGELRLVAKRISDATSPTKTK